MELAVQRISEDEDQTQNGNSAPLVEHFMPYGVYKPVKLSMFGIPDDQQLTARQILDLYYALAEADPAVKSVFFFSYHGWLIIFSSFGTSFGFRKILLQFVAHLV